MRATSGPSKQNLIVEVIIKLLGLDVCADTGAPGWAGVGAGGLKKHVSRVNGRDGGMRARLGS